MSGDVTLGAIKRLNFVEYSYKDNQTANSAGTQAAGTQIVAGFTRFATVAGASYSATAPKAIPGRRFVIANDGANSLALFPYLGDAIGANAANASYLIPSGGLVEFYCLSPGIFKPDAASNLNPFFAATAYNTNAATAGTTLTAANISGGNVTVLNMTGTLAGAANAQLPTVAQLVAAIPGAQIGQSYEMRIINTSSGAFAWTITTNTGWTLNGTMSIAQNTTRDFLVTLTSLTTATIQQIGTGTTS
jgi:hypothetical protein